MSLLDTASLIVTPNGYKASKLYSIVPSNGAGDMDVTRATTATRVKSNGLIESVAINVPRIDYLNSTCPSILVEPQRTNLQTYSEDFSNAVWIKVNSSINTNVSVAPDGNTSGDKLIEDTNTGRHSAAIVIVPATSGDYTFSVFVKASGRTKFQIDEAFSVGGAVNFDLTAGTATTFAPAKNGKIENYGNGWYRCSGTWPFTAGATTVLYLNLLNSASNNTYTGDGTSGVILWGAQLEAGSNATSYIPTVASTVTRNADVISKTGISSLIGTEFTLFLDAYETTGGNSSRYLILKGTGGTYANAVFLEANSSNQVAVTVLNSSSSTVFADLSTALTNGQRFKVAVRCKNNDFAFYLNGVQIATQTSGTVPTTADLYLGYYSDYDNNYNKINSAMIWKEGLTNEELATLTTI